MTEPPAESSPHVVAAAVTGTGPLRDLNEDAAVVLAPQPSGLDAHLVAVADGLGGHQAGEVASRLVVDTLAAQARESRADRAERWMRQAFASANLAVHDYGADHPEAFNLQSTATALVVADDHVVIGHVGDCRAYLVRQGGIELCTIDHTRAREMLRLRLITPEQAVDHPARSQLTRSLGAELMVQTDIVRRDARAGDTWVLCSDGAWNVLPRADIASVVAAEDPAAAAERLVRIACDRNTPDNVTVAVVRVEAVRASTSPRGRRWFGRR